MAGKREGLGIIINFGTTYSCLRVWQHKHVEIIANSAMESDVHEFD